jgi:hypothetical protein
VPVRLESVVILGPSFRSYLESVARGFQQNGIAATPLSYPEPAIGVRQVLELALLPRRGLTFFRDNLVGKVVDQAREASRTAQLLVLIKSDAIPLGRYEALLRSVTCPKVLWLMDSVHGVKDGLERARRVDGVFYFEGTDSSALSALSVPCHHVAMAADPYWYKPLDGASARWSFSFIGQLYDNRLALLEAILRELPPDLRPTGRIVGSYRSYLHPLRAARDRKSTRLNSSHRLIK